MRRATGALLLLALLGAGAAASASQSAIPQGFTVVARSDLYRGVEYLKLTKGSPAVVAHVAHLVPGAPVDLRVVNADDKLSTSPGDLETTSSMCGRVHCIVGVNGDFHDNGVPVGAVIADGRMLQSPDPARPQLTVTKDGHVVAGALPWTGSLTFADGAQVGLGAVNTGPAANGLALYTPDYGPSTPASNRTELLVKARGPVAALNQPGDVQLQGLRSGAGPIPADGAVLSGDGAAAQQLLDAWAREQKGMSPRGRLVVSSPVDASASLGAYPVVLHDGRKAVPYGNDPNLIYPQQPHTLVGWNPAGDVYLVAVDGRQAASVGVTMAEAADFLLGLGATEAVNLDGGGGTTFVEGKSVVNRPSDNDSVRPANYFERGATNALVVMARPVAPSAAPPPAPQTPPSPSPAETTPGAGTPADGDSAPGPSDTSPTVPGGDALFSPLGALADQADPSDLTTGPSAAGGTASPASAGSGAPKPQPTAAAAGQDQAALAAPAREPDKSAGGDVQKVTEVLRAPLSVASSVSAKIVDAAIGDGSRGIGSKARRVGTGITGALAVTALATRRRRRRRPEPTVGHAVPAETTAGHAAPAETTAAHVAPAGTAAGHPAPAETTAVTALPREPDVVKLVFREVRNAGELRMPAMADTLVRAVPLGAARPLSRTTRRP